MTRRLDLPVYQASYEPTNGAMFDHPYDGRYAFVRSTRSRAESPAVKVLPAFVVDRLPLDWWRPGNLHRVVGHDIHLCDDDHVRSIEWDGRLIAQGRKLFPYGHWD